MASSSSSSSFVMSPFLVSSSSDSREHSDGPASQDSPPSKKAEISSDIMDPDLYKAAMEGIVRVFQESTCQVLEVQVTPTKNTVLHVAAQFGQTECVNVILTMCSPSLLRSVNIKGETPLHISAREGHTTTVEVLIDSAKRLIPNDQDLQSGIRATKEMLRMRNVEGDTALYEAVRSNNLDMVDILTKEDPNFEHPPNYAGETPLYLAAERRYRCILSKLLQNCISQAYIGPNGRTALHAATICYDEECTEILFRWKPSLIHKADVYGWTPLHYVACLGDRLKVKKLLDLDKSVAYLHVADCDDKRTALHIAAGEGHINVVIELLSQCPDCWEMTNNRGQNILHIAAEHQQEEIIDFIFEKSFFSSLINQKDVDGNTPLHVLAAKSNYRNYDRLTQHPRADKRACNKENLTTVEVLLGDMTPDQVEVVGCRTKLNLRKGPLKLDPIFESKLLKFASEGGHSTFDSGSIYSNCNLCTAGFTWSHWQWWTKSRNGKFGKTRLCGFFLFLLLLFFLVNVTSP